ncbi:MAG: hypothetical protein U0133_02060 [Gemmatimonadales bacterium]
MGTRMGTACTEKVWMPIMEAAFNGDSPRGEDAAGEGADPNVLQLHLSATARCTGAIEHKKTAPKHRGHEEVVRELRAPPAPTR